MKSLSPKARIRWAFNYILVSIVWLLIAIISGGFIESALNLESGTIFSFAFLLAGVVLIPYFIYIELRYRNFTYAVGERQITVRKGIINFDQSVVPFERIQNINIEMDIISRFLNIATVKIETAGSNPTESEVELPGIENAKEFVTGLIKIVEEQKGIVGAVENTKEDVKTEVDKMKDEIAKEIKIIKEDLSSKSTDLGNILSKMKEDMNDELKQELSSIKEDLSKRSSELGKISQELKEQIKEELKKEVSTEIEEIKNHILEKHEYFGALIHKSQSEIKQEIVKELNQIKEELQTSAPVGSNVSIETAKKADKLSVIVSALNARLEMLEKTNKEKNTSITPISQINQEFKNKDQVAKVQEKSEKKRKRGRPPKNEIKGEDKKKNSEESDDDLSIPKEVEELINSKDF